jgi:tRNA pseudouridine38-40 synthase
MQICADPASTTADAGRNIRLLLEYDGSDFSGWQIQDNGRTVQGELEKALTVLLREPVRPVGSGRTDAGTHALGQVAHFCTRSEIPIQRLAHGLNGLLPDDIAVREAAEAPPDFHARYSAKRKRYRYRIRLGKAAVERPYVWCWYRDLDVAAMREAAQSLPGTHDFGAFCKQDPVPVSLSCSVYAADLQIQGTEIGFEIEANRFLRHMVRVIVGTLTEVGTGRRPAQDMTRLLASGDRGASGVTAPACGLCLLWVRYGSD